MDCARNAVVRQYVMVRGAGPSDESSAIQHYYSAKKVADYYLLNSGPEYLILRQGRLLDVEGRGLVELSTGSVYRTVITRDDLAIVICLEKMNLI